MHQRFPAFGMPQIALFYLDLYSRRPKHMIAEHCQSTRQDHVDIQKLLNFDFAHSRYWNKLNFQLNKSKIQMNDLTTNTFSKSMAFWCIFDWNWKKWFQTSSENTYFRMAKWNEYHFNVIFKCCIRWSQLVCHEFNASWTQRFIVYVNMKLISNNSKKKSNQFSKESI